MDAHIIFSGHGTPVDLSLTGEASTTVSRLPITENPVLVPPDPVHVCPADRHELFFPPAFSVASPPPLPPTSTTSTTTTTAATATTDTTATTCCCCYQSTLVSRRSSRRRRRRRRPERAPHRPADPSFLFPNVCTNSAHSIGPETVPAIGPSPIRSLRLHCSAVPLHQAAPSDGSLNRCGSRVNERSGLGWGAGCGFTDCSMERFTDERRRALGCRTGSPKKTV